MMDDSPAEPPLLALRTASLQAQLKATRSLPFAEGSVADAVEDPAEDALRRPVLGGSVVSHSFCSAARGWAFGFWAETLLQLLLLLKQCPGRMISSVFIIHYYLFYFICIEILLLIYN